MEHGPSDNGMTGEVARGAGVAAWRQIADAIERDIRSGRLAPGSRLPAEAALATRFGVNRHTARRAIASLSAKGIVRATQGSGTFVQTRPLSYAIGPRTRFSENIARAGHEPLGECLGSAVEPATGLLAERLSVPVGAPLLRLDHRRLVDGAPAVIGTRFLPLPRFAEADRAYAATGSMSAALAACGVADYRRRSTRIAARLAGADEAARLDLAPGRVLFVVESVDVDGAGVPILASTSLFPADRFEFEVET